MRVVHSVAEATETDPMDLPTLYETIDPDALERLIDGLDNGVVRFSYADQVVTIQSDGTIDVAGKAEGGSAQKEVEADD